MGEIRRRETRDNERFIVSPSSSSSSSSSSQLRLVTSIVLLAAATAESEDSDKTKHTNKLKTRACVWCGMCVYVCVCVLYVCVCMLRVGKVKVHSVCSATHFVHRRGQQQWKSPQPESHLHDGTHKHMNMPTKITKGACGTKDWAECTLPQLLLRSHRHTTQAHTQHIRIQGVRWGGRLLCARTFDDGCVINR